MMQSTSILNYIKQYMATPLIDPIIDYGHVMVHNGLGAHGTQNQIDRQLIAEVSPLTLTPESQTKITLSSS